MNWFAKSKEREGEKIKLRFDVCAKKHFSFFLFFRLEKKPWYRLDKRDERMGEKREIRKNDLSGREDRKHRNITRPFWFKFFRSLFVSTLVPPFPTSACTTFPTAFTKHRLPGTPFNRPGNARSLSKLFVARFPPRNAKISPPLPLCNYNRALQILNQQDRWTITKLSK